MSISVVAFSGSLRKNSFTTKLVKAFIELAPDGVSVAIVDIGDLPFINQDLEENLPPSVTRLHEQVKGADAVLLATPEYNRSYSPVLKNALDWGSRPQGQNAWDGKPALVLGCSPYSLGGFGAVHHLRQVLTYLNMQPLQQPEFYLSQAGDKFDASGKLTDTATIKLIANVWTAFLRLTRQSGKQGEAMNILIHSFVSVQQNYAQPNTCRKQQQGRRDACQPGGGSAVPREKTHAGDYQQNRWCYYHFSETG